MPLNNVDRHILSTQVVPRLQPDLANLEFDDRPRGRHDFVREDASAPPLWDRFYEISTNRPMFVGRDGVIKDSLSEIEHERRVSYSYLGEYAKELLGERYPAWKERQSAK